MHFGTLRSLGRAAPLSVISGGTLAGVIIFALLAGLIIGVFTGYLIWGIKLFGCRFGC